MKFIAVCLLLPALSLGGCFVNNDNEDEEEAASAASQREGGTSNEEVPGFE